MKTILIAGITGFLGSEIGKRICSKYKVVGLKRSYSSIGRIANFIDTLELYDVDKVCLDTLFQEYQFDIVLNAVALQRKSRPSFGDLIESNILFPVRLAELSIKYNAQAFINTNTILPRKTNDYSLSKHQLSEWLEMFEKDLTIVDMYLELFFGCGEDDSQFIKSMIIRMLNGDAEINLTAGRQERDLIYIDDVVDAFVSILENIDSFSSYTKVEVGRGSPVKISVVMDLIKNLTKSKTLLNYGAIPYSDNDLMYFKANTSVLNGFGWQPKTIINEGIAKSIECIKKGRE